MFEIAAIAVDDSVQVLAALLFKRESQFRLIRVRQELAELATVAAPAGQLMSAPVIPRFHWWSGGAGLKRFLAGNKPERDSRVGLGKLAEPWFEGEDRGHSALRTRVSGSDASMTDWSSRSKLDQPCCLQNATKAASS